MNNATSKSIQELKNLSADQSVVPHIPREGMMGKASDGSWYNVSVNPLTGETGNNSSTALSYDVNGDLQYIDETIGATTYRTTLTYTARVLVGISAAVEL